MIRRFGKKIGILMIIIIAIYGAMTLYSNLSCSQKMVSMPDAEDARYSVLIKNTGGILLTDKYTEHDSYVTLYGYWELYGKKFKYKDETKVLDENIFGDIEVKRRLGK